MIGLQNFQLMCAPGAQPHFDSFLIFVSVKAGLEFNILYVQEVVTQPKNIESNYFI